MNKNSSRSHCIFTIYLEVYDILRTANWFSIKTYAKALTFKIQLRMHSDIFLFVFYFEAKNKICSYKIVSTRERQRWGVHSRIEIAFCRSGRIWKTRKNDCMFAPSLCQTWTVFLFSYFDRFCLLAVYFSCFNIWRVCKYICFFRIYTFWIIFIVSASCVSIACKKQDNISFPV